MLGGGGADEKFEGVFPVGKGGVIHPGSRVCETHS